VEQLGGVGSRERGVEHRQQNLLLLAEMQLQDRSQADQLVGDVTRKVRVGPPLLDRRGGIGEAVDSGNDLRVIGLHGAGRAGGSHGLLDCRVQHLLFCGGVRYEVPAQETDDVAERLERRLPVPAGHVVGGSVEGEQLRQQLPVLGAEGFGRLLLTGHDTPPFF
jgi:hypothetical protein